ncbi:hypothetical protein [Curtobacterium flaccumfaciens]|uniref:hypothetical protein n=1 Tax=Curtobacterium flaccumfaciens TaxID=2035 RepID=UPI003995EC37
MSRWARGWSIRTRTALTFALAAMALATGVVLFTNTMSLAGVDAGLDTAVVQRAPAGAASATSAPAAIEVDRTAADRGGAVAVIRLVAVQQWQWSAIGIAGAGLRGTVLEPFAGSGTTVEACLREGFDVIAIEREAVYLPLIEKRIRKDHAQSLDFDWGEAS